MLRHAPLPLARCARAAHSKQLHFGQPRGGGSPAHAGKSYENQLRKEADAAEPSKLHKRKHQLHSLWHASKVKVRPAAAAAALGAPGSDSSVRLCDAFDRLLAAYVFGAPSEERPWLVKRTRCPLTDWLLTGRLLTGIC